jgi:hypothetical protein
MSTISRHPALEQVEIMFRVHLEDSDVPYTQQQGGFYRILASQQRSLGMKIGPENNTVQLLAADLRTHNKLTKISLYLSGHIDFAARILADALLTNNCLEDFHMSGSCTEAPSYFATLLSRNTSLLQFSLMVDSTDTKTTARASAWLLQSLLSNHTLTVFTFHDAGCLTQDAVANFCNELRHVSRSALRVVYLYPVAKPSVRLLVAVATLLRSNRQVTDFHGRDGYPESTKNQLRANEQRRVQELVNWMRIVITARFVSAVTPSSLRYSILSLIPSILSMMNPETGTNTRLIDLDAFMNTKYFSTVLQVSAEGINPNVDAA